MNAIVKNTSTPLQDSGHMQNSQIILDASAMESMMAMANLMASGRCTIPQHLQKSPADCMAVVMQSIQWGMNPFAVAQKTHVTQGGALGYEAQLISAVISANAPVKEDAPQYEYIGDWSKVLGKVEERKSEKGGKYYVATYTKADESGLGVICRMTMRSESAPRETTLMMSQCYPRFSTQWATDPKQQISYAAIRKWARLFSPGTILGVYTPDELETQQPINMGAVQEVAAPAIDVGLLEAAQSAASEGVASYSAFWKAASPETRKAIGKDEHNRLKDVATAADSARTVDQSEPVAAKGFDEILSMLCAAQNIDALYVAGEWIHTIEDLNDQNVLAAKFDEMKAELEPAQ